MEAKALDFKKILKGVLFSLVFSILTMGILSVIVFFTNISDRTVSLLIFILSALSVFLGALIVAKNISSRGLLNGLVLGLGYFAVLALLSLCINGSVALETQNLMRLVAALAAGMLGGVMGINTQK
ncbi:MAG: TIGR04086 family membrane protein [Clostridia bacterium]|nr:TIGR04086 family membrane protein [Clostridia bacterium]